MADRTPICAAVVCSDGAMIDRLFQTLFDALRQEKHPVSGVLQRRAEFGDTCCADMGLEMLSTGETIEISQPLGKESQGCRLNPGALSDITVRLTRELDSTPDLLLLNRFGKGEHDGQGFRQLIAKSLDQNIPVLTAVRPPYLDSWREFTGDLGVELPGDLEAVQSWCSSILPARH
ncbi:DUF2478 domain-containing protein [Roseibium sp.]|uniref:DUF2478 domain-containing protein n=1 Tax=Roseibium sp. TaxID=1936156 RepID=UPI003B526779